MTASSFPVTGQRAAGRMSGGYIGAGRGIPPDSYVYVQET